MNLKRWASTARRSDVRRRVATATLVTLGMVALIPAAGSAAAKVQPPAKPTVSTGAAKSVTYNSAVLTGTVNPNGQPTTYYFQYGTTTTYGSQTAPVSVGAGRSSVAASVTATGLAAVTKYHYRLVASSPVGVQAGTDRAFTTAAVPLTLAITAQPNPVLYGGTATVEGTLAGTGNGGKEVELQQNPFPYTAGFSNVLLNPEVTTPSGSFTFNVPDVTSNTQYRVVTTSGKVVTSSPVIEGVALKVSLSARRVARNRIRLSGVVSPAEPGASVQVQKLVHAKWETVTVVSTSTGSVSRFSRTLKVRRGGYYRVFVTPSDGGFHVAGASLGVLAK